MNFFLALFFILVSSAFAREQLCEGVVLHGKKIDFSAVEKRLLCGDRELRAYRDIPPYQAKFFLRGFLQSRGHLNPKFEYQGHTLHAWVGGTTKVRHIQILPLDLIEGSEAREELWQLYNGRVITPGLLNAMEDDLLAIIKRRAYACVALETVVNSSDGSIIFELTNLKRFKFGPVERESHPEVYDSVYQRFNAFVPDEAYDAKKLQLTEKRLVRSGMVQASYFTETCSSDKQRFELSQSFIFGPPRTVRFGAGVSTEAGPLVRAQWSHNRYKKMASQLDGSLLASFRNQSLNFSTQNYFWPRVPRRSLVTGIQFLRDSQVDYEEVSANLKSHPQWTRDLRGRFWQWSAGPTLQSGYFRTDRDEAREHYSALAIEGDVLSMSHDFEFYDFHPQDGNKFQFHFDLRHPDLGFDSTLLKLDFSSTVLTQLWRWGRGDAIGGVRFNLSTTSVDQTVDLDSLPPSVKYYGGGSDDIRGFPLRSLPENNGRGALSKLSVKFELRKTHLVRPAFEGMLFYDAGIFGAQSWSLDPKLFHSPGVGARWLSPVGLVQTFIAKGHSNNPFHRHQDIYFVGLGGTF